MPIIIKTPQEIEKMYRSGQILRQVHEHIRPLVVAGASTLEQEALP